MSVKHIILGFLMEESSHGYLLRAGGMKKMFGDFGINDGQLYPTLKKLEQEGLVSKEIQHQEGAPSRHIYTVTEEGRQEFLDWLASDEGEERSFRYDFFRKDLFFMRCNYIRYLDKPLAVAKIEQQIKTVENTIADLDQARQSMVKKRVDPLRISILEYGIRSQETRLAWLRDFMSEVQNQK
ncbi:MAG: PadR family transcriptional regulator [Candidatus Saccharibacteria bacterium]